MTTYTGTSGNDTLVGTSGNDTFDISQGGNDTVNGLDGNDTITAGAGLTAADTIDGGTGNDTLILDGSYLGTTAVTFSATTLQNVENVTLIGNSGSTYYNYKLTTNDATVAAGQTLTINATQIAPNRGFTFDGSAEKDGNFVIDGSGNGTANLKGGAGNDVFDFATGFSSGDIINGGSGNDTLIIGNYAGSALPFGPKTFQNIDTLVVGGGNQIDLNDGNVARGKTLTVEGTGLARVNGSAETDGNFLFIVESGYAFFDGGANNDTFDVGDSLGRGDQLNGEGGVDTAALDGDYSGSNSVVMTYQTLTSIEILTFAAGHSYDLTENDANVAVGQTLTVDGSALGVGDSLTFDGSAETNGSFIFKGGAGLGTLTGGAGNDSFVMGANLDVADQIDGGAGNDTLSLSGNYAGVQALTFTATTIQNIKTILLGAGFNYNLTTVDANVGAGQTLTVNGSAIGARHTFAFNGAAETDGGFVFIGATGGSNKLTGGAGNDTFEMGGGLTATDRINGGGGNDTLTLNGDYSAGLVLGTTTVAGVDQITLAAGHSYNLTTNDATVAKGKTLTVDGSALGAGDSLVFDGSTETNGSFHISGGAGNDTLTGGSGADSLTGGGAADMLTGGAGKDTFVYNAVSDSANTNYDTIVGFSAAQDTVSLPFAVTGVDRSVTGTLSTATFDSDLSSALNAAHLAANHAVLFTANAGTLSGQTFLVIDGNNTAGYQAGSDYVIDMSNGVKLTSLTTANFVTH